MKISLNWLQQYISVDNPAEELSNLLPMIGHEVDEVSYTGVPPLPNVVVGEVVKKEQHPDADRLSVCEVQVGDNDVHQIVCGASNFKEGDRIPVALVGACLPGNFKIKKSKLRGVKSMGMMCSPTELGLGADSKGLLILEDRPEIGTSINEVFTDTDATLDIALTANRGDCASHIGIARELAAYLEKDVTLPEVKSLPLENESGSVFKISTENCPYYSAWKIKGVKVGPSPEWLQKLVTAVGLRPVNNVVDITNYVMYEMGQPLHAFDQAKISGKINIRQATADEKITTLDEKERTLDDSMMVIADDKQALVVAGIMGSLDAEVNESTTDLVLEAAYFNAPNIRATSRKLGLHTDSSYRFARDVDTTQIVAAAERAIGMILEIAGGTLETSTHAGELPATAPAIEFDPKYVSEVAGFDIPVSKTESILKALNFEMGSNGVTPPPYRKDVTRAIDLAEEVIRIVGTDNIPAADIEAKGLSRKDDPIAQFNHAVTDYLSSQHYTECIHYSLRSKDDALATVALDNPLTAEHTHLRGSLIPGLLDALVLNQNNHTNPVRLFEVGRVFKKTGDMTTEYTSVAFVIAEPQERSWTEQAETNFYDAKNTLLQIAEFANVRQFEFIAETPELYQSGHAARVGEHSTVGLMDMKFTKQLGITGAVYAGELTLLPEQFKKAKKLARFKPFSQFPASSKDLAVIMDSTIPAETIRQEFEAIANKSVKEFTVDSVKIFDVYQGKGLEENQKSLAFEFRFKAEDRTLKDNEVMAAFDSIQNEIKNDSRFTIRS